MFLIGGLNNDFDDDGWRGILKWPKYHYVFISSTMFFDGESGLILIFWQFVTEVMLNYPTLSHVINRELFTENKAMNLYTNYCKTAELESKCNLYCQLSNNF